MNAIGVVGLLPYYQRMYEHVFSIKTLIFWTVRHAAFYSYECASTDCSVRLIKFFSGKKKLGKEKTKKKVAADVELRRVVPSVSSVGGWTLQC